MMNLASDFHRTALPDPRSFNFPIADWAALRDELFRALKPFQHPHAQPPVDQRAVIEWMENVAGIAEKLSAQGKEELLAALETSYEKVALENYAEPWADGWNYSDNSNHRRNSLIEQLEQTMCEISALIDSENGMDEGVPEEGIPNPLPRDRQKRSRRLVSLSREAFRREQFRIKQLSLHDGDSCSRLSEFASFNYCSLETGVSLTSFHMPSLEMETQMKQQKEELDVSSVARSRAFSLSETIDAATICGLLKSGLAAELDETFARILRNTASMTCHQMFCVIAGKDQDGYSWLFDALYHERPETVTAYLDGVRALAQAGRITQDQLLSLIDVKNQYGYPVVHFNVQKRSSPTAIAYLDALRSLVQAKLITPKQAQHCAPIDEWHASGQD